MPKSKRAITKKASTNPTVKKASAKKRVTKKGAKVAKLAVPQINATAAEGPVSLDEAIALSQPRQVARALARRAISVPDATHETVAEERDRLEESQDKQEEERVREYTEIMTLMKRRGVKNLASQPRTVARTVAVGGPGFTAAPLPITSGPLQIIAEGDSWFDYPKFIIKGGVPKRLERKLGIPVLNLAKAGDEVRSMLGVKQREVIFKRLQDGCPAGGAWDVMIFSGGGNDIVGDQMALWVRDYNPIFVPSQLVHAQRFAAALQIVQSGYEDLIKMRDDLSPTTHLIFHEYDFAIPSGIGVCGFGPWLKPTFDVRNFPGGTDASFDVVKEMLSQFATMLQTIKRANTGVTVVATQGTLNPVPASWDNELHPSSDGFDLIADKFYSALKLQFPTRVL